MIRRIGKSEREKRLRTFQTQSASEGLNEVRYSLREAWWVGPDTGECDHATWQYELTSELTTIPSVRAIPDKPTAKQGIGERCGSGGEGGWGMGRWGCHS